MVPPDSRTLLAEACRLVEEYRATCLWFLREDYLPETLDEVPAVLGAIERNGDLTAYRRAGEIRRWLSPGSSARSAG